MSVPFNNNPSTKAKLNLVFDPGASITTIDTAYMDRLGYSVAGKNPRISTLGGTGGTSIGYTIEIPYLESLGEKVEGFNIACHDMSNKQGIIGLLGMNFIKHFRMDIDFSNGVIHNLKRA